MGMCCTGRPSAIRESSVDFPTLSKPIISRFLLMKPVKKSKFKKENIFVLYGGQVFQQSIGIPIGTHCSPLLADLFMQLTSSFKCFSRIKIENHPRPLIPTSALQMIFCHWTILDSVIIYTASIQMSLKLRIILVLKSLLLTLTFTLKSTTEEDLKTKLYDKNYVMTSLFQ